MFVCVFFFVVTCCSGDVKSSDWHFVFAPICATKVGRNCCWEFVKQNFERIKQSLSAVDIETICQTFVDVCFWKFENVFQHYF